MEAQEKDTPSCEACIIAKHNRTPFTTGHARDTQPFELVHSDVMGPFPDTAHGGFNYAILFTDDASSATWVALMKQKSEALARFQEFKVRTERQYETQLKRLRSDNGSEYVNGPFTA